MSASQAARNRKGEKVPGVLSDTISRRDGLLVELHPRSVQTMSPEELILVQAKLGFGNRYGFWDIPENWLPAGHRVPGKLTIDFRSRLQYVGVPSSHLDDAVLCLSRYAVLLALVPTGQGPANGRYLKPLTLWSCLYSAAPLILAASSKKFAADSPEGMSFFSRYTEDDLKRITQQDARSGVRDELNRASALCDRGLWTDRPYYFIAKVKGLDHTPAVRGHDRRPKAEPRIGKHQPLPDDYVAEGGWRALWLMKELGPSLLVIAREFVSVLKAHPLQTSTCAPETAIKRRRLALRLALSAHSWVDSKGKIVEAPPFSLQLSGRGVPKKQESQWPPTSPNAVIAILQLLQMAHLWVVLLSAGARIGEMLSVAPGSIVRAPDGTPFANGLTFKLVDRVGGVERDWPLPDVAVEAMQQQEKLCSLIHDLGHLSVDSESSSKRRSVWVRLGSRTEFTADVSRWLRTMSTSLGLTDKPGGKNLTTHRFRKSVARLAALALSGAPKILMDLFGHKTIEMTLYYILTDPAVQAEIKQIVEEVAVMRATEAIENITQYGGPAARKLIEIVDKERAQLGRDLGAADIRQLAEILTLNGQSWELVRPGVICTKLPGGTGPCTKSVGRPEPSRCRSDCRHRLEHAVLRNDVDWCISESVRLYELERDDQNEMMQEMWAGQILTHLRRFDDLCEKWSHNASVMEVLGTQEQPA